MSVSNNDNYAFPRTNEKEWPQQRGLSKRDYFAAAVIQGIMASGGVKSNPDVLAGAAYELADAMLEARKK